MAFDDKEFEKYLSEFRPRDPLEFHALTARETPKVKKIPKVIEPIFLQRWGARLAVAAVLALIAAATLVWMREHVQRQIAARNLEMARLATVAPRNAGRDIASDVSLGRLVILYNRNPAELDEALDEVSRNLLPHVERPEGALHSLNHD